ncbi:MAG: hypothetical protein AAF495_26835 [Pseudomonadota bacterium]
MDQRAENAQLGLPWPEAYKDLRGLIGERWGIGDDIYLTRQLSGGKSGAMVYLADVTSKGFTGQAVLKLDQTPDPAEQEKSEAERHIQALEADPNFAERHLPRILHTTHDGKSLAILSTIAGRGLEFAMPWSLCDHNRQVNIVQRLSRALLEDWNGNAELAPGLQSPQTLLRSWLGYRLDPELGRMYRVFHEVCGFAPEEPSFTCEGRWFPNPLAFAVARSDNVNKLKLRAMLGHIHGDLHGLNVLVSKTGEKKDQFYLIDLAFYEDRQFLLYDHGYFALSYLLATRSETSISQWLAILDGLCPFDHIRPEQGLHGDDVGHVNLLKLFRQEVFDWVDRHQPHRLSYMESQFQLAQVAVGLNFFNKRIDNNLRRRAILYAASVLKDYLKLHQVDWPKHGPPLLLEGIAPALSQKIAPAQAFEPTKESVEGSPALPEKPAIAVLAFENQSGDPEQEYFVDGIADEIITELSRVDWLMVISRGSSFSYKGHAIDAKQVGRELGVHYVVEGIVRRSADRVRVTAKLVDAQAGNQLWADRFDCEVDDVFTLQEDIAAAIVANIDARLKETTRELAKRKVGQVTLWESFQKAMWHFFKYTEPDAEIAKGILGSLEGEIPGFAGGHAALALLQTRRVFRGDPEDLDDLLEGALHHATKAVELDEGNSLARIALSRVYAFQGKYDQAILEAEMSVALNPSSTVGYLNLAGTLLWGERAEEAMEAVDKSIRLSPKGPLLPLKLLVKGVLSYFLDDYAQAERLLRQADSSPNLVPFPCLLLTAVFIRQGRSEEARSLMTEVHALRPQLSITRLKTAWRTLSPRYRDKLLGDLGRAGLPD